MIKMIWAQSANRWIGKDGNLPWHAPEDLKNFQKLTSGQTVVMGRKTLNSLPLGGLPGRRNVIVTRQDGIQIFEVCKDPALLLKMPTDFWVIGGKELFDFFMPYADELYVSEMPFDVEGDVAAPEIPMRFEVLTTTQHVGFTVTYYVNTVVKNTIN
jgi:dihydrofolate reductase